MKTKIKYTNEPIEAKVIMDFLPHRPIAMTESKLPSFSPKASIFWAAIPVEMKHRIIANVYCSHCRGGVTIINFSGSVKGVDLLLQGICAVCGHVVARLLEGADS